MQKQRIGNIELYGKQLVDWAKSGAKMDDHPAWNWEFENCNEYERCSAEEPPLFYENLAYRYNPPPKYVNRYLNNGTKIQLKEPVSSELELNQQYFFVASSTVETITWTNTVYDFNRLQAGLIHTSFDGAERWLKYKKHIFTGAPLD